MLNLKLGSWWLYQQNKETKIGGCLNLPFRLFLLLCHDCSDVNSGKEVLTVLGKILCFKLIFWENSRILEEKRTRGKVRASRGKEDGGTFSAQPHERGSAPGLWRGDKQPRGCQSGTCARPSISHVGASRDHTHGPPSPLIDPRAHGAGRCGSHPGESVRCRAPGHPSSRRHVRGYS